MGSKYDDLYRLKPAHQCRDKTEMEELKRVKLPNIKLRHYGRWPCRQQKPIETLSALRIRKVTPEEYLMSSFREPVYCQLNPRDYVERPNDHNGPQRFSPPDIFVSRFRPLPKCPTFIFQPLLGSALTEDVPKQDIQATGFHISVIFATGWLCSPPFIRANSIS